MMAPVNHIKKSIQRWTIYLCFLWAKLCASQMLTDGMNQAEKHALSKNITAILNKLVNKEYYDKRLRPNYGGNPVDVGVTIHVSSISAVSEVEMDFTLDFYLRQMWTDPRLAFSHMGVALDALTVGVEYVNAIWVPDTFFPNEKKSFFHIATTHNSFLRISSKGEIKTSQRLTVTATCPMALQLFPLDSQECSLEIESYGYSTADISYTWANGNTSVSLDPNVTLPQFAISKILPHKFGLKVQNLSTGVYSRMFVRFNFHRNIGFYMMQIFVPSILIVIISWVSFWLSRDASPARVALGVTTVLTMTTLMTTTNSSMPKVSYIKAIDIYMGTSFVMVFASLLEYAAVGYLNKKMRMKKENKKNTPMFPAEIPIALPKVPRNQGSPFIDPSTTGSRETPSSPSSTHLTAHLECDCDISTFRTLRPVKMPKSRRRTGRGVTPSKIDKYSRVVFPVIYIVFNAIYWSAYLYVSSQNQGTPRPPES